MRRVAMLTSLLLLVLSGVLYSASGAHGDAVGVTPTRLLDTREGLGAPLGRLQPGTTLTLSVDGAVLAGAQSVALNLTAVDALADGFITAWPCGQARPATSNLNVVPGHADANFVMIKLGDAGSVCLASSVPVHLVADLMGWFVGSTDFRGSAPTRVLDTRSPLRRLAAGEVRRIPLDSAAGLTSSAVAVALNVTVVDPALDGFVVVFPCGPIPTASTVNFRAGEIVPNFTVTPFTGNAVCAYSSVATDLVVDSFGWSDASASFHEQTPARLLDSRSGLGWAGGAVNSTNTLSLQVAGRAGVPAGAKGVLMTITATGGTADGFVTVWPCDQPRQLTSILNLRSGLLRSNLAFVPLSGSGAVCLWANTIDGSRVHLVADAVGWTTTPSVTAAFTESFDDPFNPARFTPAYWRDEEAGQLDPTLNGSKIVTEAGQLRIESGEQNYGDAAVRVNQPFDFTGRTGTISFDVTLAQKDGWTRFSLSQDPYAVTSYGDDNAAGQGADRGIDLQFKNFGGCANVTLRTYANRAETDLDGPQFPQPCVTASGSTLTHVVVTVSNTTVTVKAGSTTLGTWSGLNLGFSRGFLYLDSHNHATIKYAGQPTWVTHWDNVTFDGPVIPPVGVAAAATIEGRTVTGVPANPPSPRLVFNAQHGQQDANPTLSYALNGHGAHQVPLVRLPGLIGVYMISQPIDAGELVAGTNIVAFTWTGTTGLAPRVADVQIVWTGTAG
jgi:hypothetical protein